MSVLDNIKNKLAEVEKSGHRVEDLTTADPEYKYVKDARVVVNGVKLSTEEKFSLAGYPRTAKNRDLAEYIKNAIIEYRNAGGNFNVEYKDLPFIAEVRSYVNHYNANHGTDIDVEDCLRQFGAFEVSKIYKRYANVMDIKNYKDQDGFVDNYRQNPQFCGYISKVSNSLDMIDGYVVSLIGNQNLKHSYLDADYIKLVAYKIEKFALSNKAVGKLSLNLLSAKDPSLYNQVNWLVNNFCSLTGEDLSRNEVLYLLGINEKLNKDDVKTDNKKEKDFKQCMEDLRIISIQNDGKLSRKDMDSRQYNLIRQKAQRLGIDITEMFRTFEIEYVGGLSRQRFAKIMVDELPYIDEMRKERDKQYNKYLQANGNAPTPIKFENYFNACIETYAKYKSKILEQGLIYDSEY